jgi:hypothetical protein
MRGAEQIILLGGAQASQYAPYPAPSGFHWSFVTDETNGNARVTDETVNNQPVVALVGN